jgi:hypothetical protein
VVRAAVASPPALVEQAPAPALRTPFNWHPLIPLMGGAALAGGGAFFLLGAKQKLAGLTALSASPSGADPLAQGAALRDAGKRWATTGTVLVSVGAAAVLASVLWWSLAPTRPVQVSAMLTPGGGALTVGACFP